MEGPGADHGASPEGRSEEPWPSVLRPPGSAPLPMVAHEPGDEWRRNLDPEDRELLRAAVEAAHAAADVHAEEAPDAAASPWEEKGRSDFVTEVDLEAERRIIEVLGRRFPGHAIIGEEGTDRAAAADAAADRNGETDRDAAAARGPAPKRAANAEGAAPMRWIVDPLDGTTNWLHGYPEHAVSIAAADAHGVRVGVVLNSATGERFEAVRGRGARRDGDPARVSSTGELRLALIGTGFPFKKLELLADYLDVFARVLRATSGIRRGGSAALDLCDLACGRLDAFWEFWLMPWDVAAGGLILTEAGGRIERLQVRGFGVPDDEERASGTEARERAATRTPRPRALADVGGTGLEPGGYLAAAPQLLQEFRRLITGSEGS